MTEIFELSLDDLTESPFNPRQIFDDAALLQLATDIRTTGRVLQPLLVRPIVPPLFKDEQNADAGMEIVFGHRRYKAARLAGLTTVPCIVRRMDDDEARRAQISENLSRTDVHPIEEAEGFQALLDSGEHTADDLAEKYGKSRSYIYGRLKLLQACPVVRQACLTGAVGSEVALLIARLRSPKLQEKALDAIAAINEKTTDGGAKSFRRIRDLLNEKFTLELKSAIFDIEDEMLVPEAGHCIRCTKRTGNAPEFTDVVAGNESTKGSYYSVDHMRHTGADVCTDPDCFDAKKKAHLKREAAKLSDAGAMVVDGNKERAAIGADGKVKGAFIALADVKGALKKAKLDVDAITHSIQDPRTGKVVKAVRRETLEAAGVVAVPKQVKGGGSSSSDWKKKHAADETEAKRLTAGYAALLHKVRNTQRQMVTVPGLDELRDLARWCAERVGSETPEQLAALWGVGERQLPSLIADMDAADLTRVLLDCVLIEDTDVSHWNLNVQPTVLLQTAARLGIDAESVFAKAAAARSTPSEAAHAETEVDEVAS